MKKLSIIILCSLALLQTEQPALSNAKIDGGTINICEEELVDEKISNDGATIAQFIQILCSDMFFTHVKSAVRIKKNYETIFHEVYSFSDFVSGQYILKINFKDNNTLEIISNDKIGILVRHKKFKDIDINVSFYPDKPDERRLNLEKRNEDKKNWWKYNIEP